MNIRSFFPQMYELNCGKNALYRNVEKSFKKFLDPDPGADDFQNLTSPFLSKDTSLAKFS